MNSMMQTAWGLLLCRYNNTDDAVFGAVVSGRPAEIDAVENMVGLFINTLPVRLSMNADVDTFIETVQWLQQRALDSEKYDYLSLAEVQSQSEHKQNLIDHLFVFQNYPDTYEVNEHIEEQTFKITNICSFEHTNYSLSVMMYVQESQLGIKINFNALEHDRAIIKQMLSHFETILEQVEARIDIPLNEIELVGPDEKVYLLETLNDTKADYQKGKTIHALFEEQATARPKAVAVVDGKRQLTYEELNTMANRLANYLQSHGVKQETLVGICMDRSVDLLVGIMGILKAGGAYVPLDPSYPQQRLHYMVKDAGIELLVTQSTVSDWVPDNISCIYLDGAKDTKILLQESDQNIPIVTKPQNMAYLIYTSGSTGNPKGVMVEHHTLVNMVLWHQEYYEVTEHDRAMQIASIAFDAAVAEIWPYLSSGAGLYLCNERVKTDPHALQSWIVEQQITIGFMPTPMAEIMMHLHWPAHTSLRCLLTAGDLLRQSPPDSLPFALVNNYGPTECTVVATAGLISPLQKGLPPIGRPIANARLYILDPHRQPVPEGFTGELYVGGAGVARGYLNRPELTEERFLPDPFNNDPEARMYRTGDLVRYLSDGNLLYVGRMDDQVKIRGFRIELGEIEVILSQHPTLQQVAVLLQEDKLGQKNLAAYVVGEGSVQEWQEYLRERLPSHMVPTHFIQMNSMPLTPNGKIDRNSLSHIDNMPQVQASYIAPRSATEIKLVQIISNVLGIKESSIGVQDSFFALGGHSLNILTLLTKTYVLKWDLNISDFYTYNTIGELAGKIDGKIKSKSEKRKSHDELKHIRSTPQIPKDISMEKVSYKNVLLLGATGFLGIHLLYEVLVKTQADVHCIVRGNNLSNAQNRLYEKLMYYFGDSHADQFPDWMKRIYVYPGDITKSNFGLESEEYLRLGEVVDVVVNAAAIVKHYGYYEEFEKTNVQGVQHTIDFCLTYQISLHHMSTISVAGKYVEDEQEHLFTESDLFIGQNYDDNFYIRSKFEAERLIFETKGLRFTIHRLGNLTGRISDGTFQKNIEENMFYLQLKTFIDVQMIFPEILGFMVEFTPIDFCSSVVVDIMQSTDAIGKVFHIINHRHVSFGRIYEALQKLGFNFLQLSLEEANDYLKSLLNDESRSEIFSGWMTQLASGDANTGASNVIIDSAFTVHYLKQLGIQYPNLGGEYLAKLLKHMMDVHFIPTNLKND
ncbi:amino acid adenylation domain-containing protein [Paenibacillus xylanexedens]|uniref:non-ribosomal peptide synthetase family protein n=1 Tax=Paenibacillus xylanexedens TaxID=528191 RepID=UPI0021B57AA5|nr:amino acid adenylation domain-containing protein [Paenibacillus xylanexedens]